MAKKTRHNKRIEVQNIIIERLEHEKIVLQKKVQALEKQVNIEKEKNERCQKKIESINSIFDNKNKELQKLLDETQKVKQEYTTALNEIKILKSKYRKDTLKSINRIEKAFKKGC